jgi:hypothetical protein
MENVIRLVTEREPLKPSLESWFNEHADRWEKETGIHSSPAKRFMHKDYQAIMAKGPQVISLILRRMKNNPDDWFWALKFLAEEDAASNVQGFDAAVGAWLKWGADKGYVSK